MPPGKSMAMAPAPAMGWREWTMLLLLSVLWGGSFFFFKVLVATLPPLTVVLGRVGLAAVVLNLWLVLRGDFMPGSWRLWGRFAVMGLLNNVVPFSLIVFGETRIASGLAAILNATTPMFGVLIGHWMAPDERLTRTRLAGVLLGFAGVAVLVGPDARSALGQTDLAGEAACLGAAMIYAVAGFYGRRFRAIAPIKIATGQITASALILIPLVAVFDRPWTLPMPDGASWAAFAGIAVLCTVLAYILYFRILAAAGASNLLLVTLLIPPSAILLGVALLGERLRPTELAGMAVIAMGLVSIDGRLLRWHRQPG